MLTPDDARTLSPVALVLAREIGAALAPDGDGGKTISKAEGKRMPKSLDEMQALVQAEVQKTRMKNLRATSRRF